MTIVRIHVVSVNIMSYHNRV
uniref:Uncharacterized protein n=1 Tax=Anguilla anguilla TaxID=7936 RepID=A0A0E9SPL1_ANGAN